MFHPACIEASLCNDLLALCVLAGSQSRAIFIDGDERPSGTGMAFMRDSLQDHSSRYRHHGRDALRDSGGRPHRSQYSASWQEGVSSGSLHLLKLNHFFGGML